MFSYYIAVQFVTKFPADILARYNVSTLRHRIRISVPGFITKAITIPLPSMPGGNDPVVEFVKAKCIPALGYVFNTSIRSSSALILG